VQLMYYFLNGAMDYSTHLLYKDTLDHIQYLIVKQLSREDI